MITHIAFDVGDVLVNTGNFKEKLIFASQKFNLSVEEISRRYTPLQTKLEANRAKISALVPGRPENDLKKLYQEVAQKYFRLNQDVFNLAVKLKARYKVGLLSNIDQYLAEIPLHQSIYSQFSPVVLSYQEKTRKPEEKIYKIYLKLTNCPPENLLLVDNFSENLPPAEKLGMKTILFGNFSQLVTELKKLKVKV